MKIKKTFIQLALVSVTLLLSPVSSFAHNNHEKHHYAKEHHTHFKKTKKKHFFKKYRRHEYVEHYRPRHSYDTPRVVYRYRHYDEPRFTIGVNTDRFGFIFRD